MHKYLEDLIKVQEALQGRTKHMHCNRCDSYITSVEAHDISNYAICKDCIIGAEFNEFKRTTAKNIAKLATALQMSSSQTLELLYCEQCHANLTITEYCSNPNCKLGFYNIYKNV